MPIGPQKYFFLPFMKSFTPELYDYKTANFGKLYTISFI